MNSDSLELEDDLPQVDELDSLRERADQMGIKYDKRLGLEKMRELVNGVVVGDIPKPTDLLPAESDDEEDDSAAIAAAIQASKQPKAVPKVETPGERRYRLRKEATALVRVNVMNMNPFRKDWEGDTYTVGNSVIGTIKRYVPYNVDWHVEKALLNVMQERECQIFYDVKNPTTGQSEKKTRTIKELQIAILPPLTDKELKELAQRQAMASGTQQD